MDTILLSNNPKELKPYKWIYTDLLGRIQFKDIRNLNV